MKIYNLWSRKDGKREYYFNILPFITLVDSDEGLFLNIGWINICVNIKIQ